MKPGIWRSCSDRLTCPGRGLKGKVTAAKVSELADGMKSGDLPHVQRAVKGR